MRSSTTSASRPAGRAGSRRRRPTTTRRSSANARWGTCAGSCSPWWTWATSPATRATSRAASYYREGLILAWEYGETRAIAEALGGLACAATAIDQALPAVRVFAAVEWLRELTGIATWSSPLNRARYERAVTAARAALGEEAFAARWAEGRALPLAQAVAEALRLCATVVAGPSGGPSEDVPTATNLTPRELEVLRLLAVGRSNRQIADALFVSLPTVKTHVASVLAKLGLESRAAVAAYAHAHGLARR